MKQRIQYEIIGIATTFLCMVALLTGCKGGIAVQESLQPDIPTETKEETFSEASSETHPETPAEILEEKEPTSYIFTQEAFQSPNALLAEINEHAGRVDVLLTLNRSFFQAMLSAAALENSARYGNEYWRGLFAADYTEDVSCRLVERIDVNADSPIGCIVHLLCGHLDIYLLYTRDSAGNTDEYTLGGLVCTNEKRASVYRVVTYDNEFWLVVQVETEHGTGVSYFNEIWYDNTGKEVLCIQNSGYADLFDVQYQDNWYNGGVSFDSIIEKQDDNTGFMLTMKLTADFTYMKKTVFHSDEVLVYRYDAETKAFMFVPEESTLQPSLHLLEDKGYKADNSLLDKFDYHYDYDKAEAPPGEDEWVKILERKASPGESLLPITQTVLSKKQNDLYRSVDIK